MKINKTFCNWILRVYPTCLSTWMWVDMALDALQTINYYNYAFNDESTYQIWLQGQCLDQGLLNCIIFLFLDFYLNLPPLSDLTCCIIDSFPHCIAGSECKQLNPAYFRIAAAIWAFTPAFLTLFCLAKGLFKFRPERSQGSGSHQTVALFGGLCCLSS